jgi:ATP-dependent DNA ligase
MLAKLSAEIPAGEQWIYEPKWDGFRALVFRDGSELFIQSRDGKPLDRYFPELPEPLTRALSERAVLDGELVVAKGRVLDFEALQLRIHPAASRVKSLSRETPASVVFFDLLCDGDRDLRRMPFRERRGAKSQRTGSEDSRARDSMV